MKKSIAFWCAVLVFILGILILTPTGFNRRSARQTTEHAMVNIISSIIESEQAKTSTLPDWQRIVTNSAWEDVIALGKSVGISTPSNAYVLANQSDLLQLKQEQIVLYRSAPLRRGWKLARLIVAIKGDKFYTRWLSEDEFQSIPAHK